jgi:hypothetical protein
MRNEIARFLHHKIIYIIGIFNPNLAINASKPLRAFLKGS